MLIFEHINWSVLNNFVTVSRLTDASHMSAVHWTGLEAPRPSPRRHWSRSGPTGDKPHRTHHSLRHKGLWKNSSLWRQDLFIKFQEFRFWCFSVFFSKSLTLKPSHPVNVTRPAPFLSAFRLNFQFKHHSSPPRQHTIAPSPTQPKSRAAQCTAAGGAVQRMFSGFASPCT